MTGWAEIEAAFDGIFERRWYTNHGPLARQLEASCADAAGVRHAIVVTNPTIGLIMLADALCLSGEVLLSALAPPRCAQALDWAGLQPRFCDVDPRTLLPDARTMTPAIGAKTTALLGTNGADAASLTAVAAEHGLLVYQDAAQFSGSPTLIDLPTPGDDAGAAALLTDDDQLAGRLRNIRSSYGAGAPTLVMRTANGRLSEAQAAMALLMPTSPAPHPGRHLGRRTLPFGRDFLLVADDAADHADLLRELAASGARHTALALDPRAAQCPASAGVAATALILTAELA